MSGNLLALALLASSPDAAAQPQPAANQPQMTIDTEDRVARPDQWARACKDWDDWDKPAPPFRVYGNTFYVGTCGITVLFVAGENGTVMIDTGTETGVWHALRNVGRIGYDPQHIGLLLYSHEHFDHVGGMAAAQIYTMAPVLASPDAAEVFRTGKDDPRDPQAGLRELNGGILLTPHPSASDMIARAATGSFAGGPTCAEYADSKAKALDERLAKEAADK